MRHSKGLSTDEFASWLREHCLRCCIVPDDHGVIARMYRDALHEARASLDEATAASQWVAQHMPAYQSQVLTVLIQRIHSMRRGGGIKYVTEVAREHGLDDETMRATQRHRQEMAAEWRALSQEEREKWIKVAVERFGESLRRHPNSLEFAAQYTRRERRKEQATGDVA